MIDKHARISILRKVSAANKSVDDAIKSGAEKIKEGADRTGKEFFKTHADWGRMKSFGKGAVVGAAAVGLPLWWKKKKLEQAYGIQR